MAWLEGLEEARLQQFQDAKQLGELSEFARRQILALNFEISSHAARASALLRQVEEGIGAADLASTESDRAGIRQLLKGAEDLPGIPRRDRDAVPLEHVQHLWQLFTADRDRLTLDERLILLDLDAQAIIKEGIFLNVGGETREERLAAQEEMAAALREVKWAEIHTEGRMPRVPNKEFDGEPARGVFKERQLSARLAGEFSAGLAIELAGPEGELWQTVERFQGAKWRHPAQGLFELAAFTLFMFQFLISNHVRVRPVEVARHMWHRAASFFEVMSRDGEMPPLDKASWLAYLEARYKEYSEAMEEAARAHGRGLDVLVEQLLAHVGSDEPEPQLTQAVKEWFLKHAAIGEALGELTIVD